MKKLCYKYEMAVIIYKLFIISLRWEVWGHVYRGVSFASFCDFSFAFWICSDSVVFLGFHFIICEKGTFMQLSKMKALWCFGEVIRADRHN